MNFSDDMLRGLVEIVAKVDALYLPVRDWKGDRPATTAQMRRAYPNTGVKWHGAAGGGANERKAAQLLRDRLGGAGWIKLVRRKTADRAIGCLLTSAGEFIARKALDLPTIDQSLPALDRLWELRNDPDEPRDVSTCWARETSIDPTIQYGQPGMGKAAAELEHLLLPALIRGLVTSNSDMQGHVFYGIDAGPRKKFKVSRPPKEFPEFDEELWALYLSTVKAALAELDTVPPKPAELGMIPIAVSYIPRGEAA